MRSALTIRTALQNARSKKRERGAGDIATEHRINKFNVQSFEDFFHKLALLEARGWLRVEKRKSLEQPNYKQLKRERT